MEAMERWLSSQQGDLSAPGLHLLEAALASWRYCPAGVLPEGLREDLQQALGEEEVQAAVSNLLACHILEEVPGQESSGLRLREEARTTVSAYLRRTREKVLWRTAQGMVTGETYLFQLVQYLQQLEPSCTVATGQDGELFLTVEGERYQIWRTLSPFWLPLAVKEEDGDRILVFGPFAAQDWGRLYPYYDWEAFRDTIALYDPWRQEKMSLCRGRVPVYIDWFHRDQYQGRFSIPVKFCDVLHQLVLMRYNDERDRGGNATINAIRKKKGKEVQAMTNELLLVGTLVAYFGFMLLAYKLFGRAGLYGFTIFATVVGNIEVLLLVNAFGMDQTLGNVIFATTYSAAKILSEMEGEKGPDYAKKATWLSVGTTGVFMLITQTWAWYAPADGGLLQQVFSNSPRIMLSSLVVYAICMLVQIAAYKFIWTLQKHRESGQWVRAGVSTLFTQLVNTILFTLFAFLGVYEFSVMVDIMLASYIIFIVTSFWDTLVQIVAKKTCKKSNILFKEID